MAYWVEEAVAGECKVQSLGFLPPGPPLEILHKYGRRWKSLVEGNPKSAMLLPLPKLLLSQPISPHLMDGPPLHKAVGETIEQMGYDVLDTVG